MAISFDSDGFSKTTEDATFYYFKKYGNEFIYSGGEKTTVFEGVALPDNVTLEPPPLRVPENKQIFWDPNEKIWIIDEDHIGETIYFTQSGVIDVVTKRGPIPENWTTKPYPGKDYFWNKEHSDWEILPEVKVKKEYDSRIKEREERLNKTLTAINNCNNFIDAGVNVDYFKDMKTRYQAILKTLYEFDVDSQDPIPEILGEDL